MTQPELPLPDDVPALPAGRFYRVKRTDMAFAPPAYAVEIREQGKRFSRRVHGTETRVKLDGYGDAEDAVIQACIDAFYAMLDRDDERAAAMDAELYVGDHGREAS